MPSPLHPVLTCPPLGATWQLSRYSEGLMTLTPAFVARLYEVVHTYDGRLDYNIIP